MSGERGKYNAQKEFGQMKKNYSPEVCIRLQSEFDALGLSRPMRLTRYEPGTELVYTVDPVAAAESEGLEVRLVVEKFVGGGFAGQVYRVRMLSVEPDLGGCGMGGATGLEVDRAYAMKIMIPPSRFALFFRNLLYAIGFQGQFQLQTNPAAVRSGALWQKFIRACATHRFNDPGAVNDIHATFVDTTLGSCGELSDWVEGRTWRLEVDDRMDMLRRWKKGKVESASHLGSPEYRSKYTFMKEFVKLLHDVGAHEFARQYEWSTCKSQPNCLKRSDAGEQPQGGLTAVDFRSGLVLLPFLPMSPGDFKLIAGGIRRGSLVQFDRGDNNKLRSYIDSKPEVKESIPLAEEMLGELENCDRAYRESVPDITHNFFRLFCDARLWRGIWNSAARGWRLRNLIDDEGEAKLAKSHAKAALFFLVGIFPLLGRVMRRCWGHKAWLSHYCSMLKGTRYFGLSVRGRLYEKLIQWHRAGRLSAQRALKLSCRPFRCFLHYPLSALPPGVHRFLTDKKVFREKMHYLFVRPIKLYFQAPLRVEWLRDMVSRGMEKDILSEEDAQTITARMDEPYIQRYLVSLVVHLMTLPVTQVVSLAVAGYFYFSRPELSQAERTAVAAGIFALFQVIPLSPGSLCRGLYTTGMAIHDRNFKDYNIAIFLSYFKYVGYLAFPVQMAYRYPALARFMAAHWATDAVKLVPVFGERGALLEHGVFSLFYNWPLTLRRRMAKVSKMRSGLPARLWHLPAVTLAGACALVLAHYFFHLYTGAAPSAGNVWYLRPLLPLIFLIALLSGWSTTRFAGGMQRGVRIVSAAIAGLASGVLYSAGAFFLEGALMKGADGLLAPVVWRGFVLVIFCVIGAAVTEAWLSAE